MGIVISKFGGTSLSDADGFRRCARILSRRGQRQYVIVSAPGRRFDGDSKITDLLSKGDDKSLSAVKRRFDEIARSLGLAESFSFFPQMSKSALVSRGEYSCAKMMAEFLGLPFVDAESLFFFDANGCLLRDETACAIRDMASRVPSAVIPGFYGRSPNGIYLFPRGGSDVSASIIASALRAGLCENWTDVDGLMSADPAICPDAICHPLVSFLQMEALARAGARVLHPDSLKPLMESDVPLVIRNTFAPERPGTYVSGSVRRQVRCVCAKAGYGLINPREKRVEPLLARLDAPAFTSQSGKRLFPVPDSGALSMIAVFGLSRDALPKAIRPIAIAEGEDCVRILVRTRDSDAAMRAIHAKLLEPAR